MTVAEFVQLYTPMAGLIGMAFWMGVLSQRVRSLENSTKTDKTDSERLVRVEVSVENLQDELKQLHRGIEGVQRQLGNLMTTKGRTVVELPTA